jgi:ABC-type multidrug transport system ATPase subunit
MKIQLEQVAKKFNKEWIFKNLSCTLSRSDITAVTGPNGSGKSTLLQVIAGSLLQSEGRLTYTIAEKIIEPDVIYKHISLVAPAMSLPEDFTLMEFLAFHFKFKNLRHGFHLDELPAIMKLQDAAQKYIKNFSTGMKQRVKLGIAFYSDAPLLLLDEPATNLDSGGFEWYLEEIHKVLNEKLIIVCSNRKDEYSFCNNFIDILAYKN